MIRLYDKWLVPYAQDNLGTMLEYVVIYQHIDIVTFYDIFLTSDISNQFEHGIKVIDGLSGIELAHLVADCSGLDLHPMPAYYLPHKDAIYWVGWALAYYQWASTLPFAEIEKYTPIKEIFKMYSTFHEMDVVAFCECMDTHYLERKKHTNLELRRKFYKLSQKQLAHAANVPFQTIDAYEKEIKDINYAPACELISFSRIMLCTVESLLEYRPPQYIA